MDINDQASSSPSRFVILCGVGSCTFLFEFVFHASLELFARLSALTKTSSISVRLIAELYSSNNPPLKLLEETAAIKLIGKLSRSQTIDLMSSASA